MKQPVIFFIIGLLVFLTACKKGGVASKASGKFHGPIHCTYNPSVGIRDTNYLTIITVAYVDENTISINNTPLTFTVANQFWSSSRNGISSVANFDSAFTHIVYRDQSGSAYGCTFDGDR